VAAIDLEKDRGGRCHERVERVDDLSKNHQTIVPSEEGCPSFVSLHFRG
jgi:hypothetical protein